MIESLVGALNAVKQATPTLLLGVAVACALLLFLPPSATGALGLSALIAQYRAYIGGTSVVSLALLLSHGIASIARFVKTFYAKRKAKASQQAAERRRLENLNKLTPDEKGYLLPYISDQLNTQHFGIDDGVAGGLQAKSIIYRAANVGDMVNGFAFNIQPWAREHLDANPQLLEGARLPSRNSRW